LDRTFCRNTREKKEAEKFVESENKL